MPTANPEAAVQARLVAQIATLKAPTKNDPPFDGNCILGPLRGADVGDPRLCVFVHPTGGRDHYRLLGSSSDVKNASVQVLVRGDQYAFDTGLALARSCIAALHAAALTGYIYCLVREPEPQYVSFDGEAQHVWSFNVELLRIT